MWDPSVMLKSYGVGWGRVVAHEILVSAQGSSVLGFWVLGLRVWGLGLTMKLVTLTCQIIILILKYISFLWWENLFVLLIIFHPVFKVSFNDHILFILFRSNCKNQTRTRTKSIIIIIIKINNIFTSPYYFIRYSPLLEDKSENLRNIVDVQWPTSTIFLRFEDFVRGQVGYIFFVSRLSIRQIKWKKLSADFLFWFHLHMTPWLWEEVLELQKQAKFKDNFIFSPGGPQKKLGDT